MTFSGSLLTRRSRARILSNAFKLFSLLLCAAGISLRAQDGQSPAPVRSLIEAEMTFARMASEKGTRDSFLAFLAEDSVVFEPGPRNGRKVWTGHRPSPDVLTWRPAFVTVSQAGDLGYSTGPWEWKKEPSNSKPTAYGQFFSIWQKQKEGAWKVALDLGVDTPAPIATPDTPEPEAAEPAKRAGDEATARAELHKTQRAFFAASEKDNGAAVATYASADVRVYRQGVFPAIGRDAARVMLTSDHAPAKFSRAGGKVSGSADLAYEYGAFAVEHNDFTERGNYVTVWKISPEGDWKLAIDLRKTAPQAEKKANQ